MFPNRILEIVKDLPFKEDNTGRSGDKVYIFGNKYILKVSTNLDVLKREATKMEWLSSRGLCPKPILTFVENGKYYYLREFLDGNNLINDKYINNPDLLIKIVLEALSKLREIDNANCPFESVETKGNSFVHGDLCLPNIYADSNDNFLGFTDLDNSGLGDPWWDYSWLLWSINYNLKTDKYNKLILDYLNIDFNEEKYTLYTKID